MKTFVCLVLFALLSVISCESELCSKSVHSYCNYEEKFPKKYPDTVDELTKGCNDLLEVARCYLNFYESCEEYADRIHLVQRFIDFVEPRCQEESEAFKVISNNIDCLTPNIKKLEERCSLDFIEETDFESLLKQAGDFLDVEYRFDCLDGLWDTICKSQKMVQRCGSELSDVLSDILEFVNYHDLEKCKTENLSALSAFRQNIELLVSEVKWAEEIDKD